MKFTFEEFLKKLPLPAGEKWKNGVSFTNAFTKGDFQLEFFAPRGKDYQTPHEADEFYIVARHGRFAVRERKIFLRGRRRAFRACSNGASFREYE